MTQIKPELPLGLADRYWRALRKSGIDDTAYFDHSFVLGFISQELTQALSQQKEEVRREVLEEVWLEVRHSKPKFYGKDIDDETEQLIQDISYETKCQILDDIHELFPVKSKYSQEAPSPKYDKTK